MIGTQEIDRQIADIDQRVTGLKAELDGLAFAAVNGDPDAKSKVTGIRADIATAAADRDMLEVARVEAERLEDEQRRRDEAEARRVARENLREAVRPLIAKAEEVAGQIEALRAMIADLERLQIEANRAHVKAGKPLEHRSFIDAAAREAVRRVGSMFDPFAQLTPLGDVVSGAWEPLFERDDADFEHEAVRQMGAAAIPPKTPEEHAADLAAEYETARRAREAYEAEPLSEPTSQSRHSNYVRPQEQDFAKMGDDE
ncbi:MAG: hypothetical protein BGO82_05950 [Devosia sp. 67-54]|uniref:hypothetical protein n=1 Tax=unclassified Devosia TaxID=196773 RepID=UPI00095E49AD|nr:MULTISPECIES: hypothetical protein [unclassified Devosia]MBN9306839.1 hypothetical protein [Devosia sp.]OJX17055.1 MAG: hypothetical protein BGO82_05950 [Devosia sp. 67-54]